VTGNRVKYVVRTEEHHPGFTDYLVISTEAGFVELSQAIERLSKLSNGARIDFRIGDKARFGKDGHIAFAVCSEEKLQQLSDKSFKSRAASLLSTFVLLGIFLIGAAHSLRYIGGAVAWVISKV